MVLLDNFEDVIDLVTQNIIDGEAELDEALRALVRLPHHGVKVILTTRVAPRALNLLQPSRQMPLVLDEGLESPYAENILREMDADGKLGLKSATDARLAVARERTRGFPRALEAVYAILSADRDTTLEEVVAGASTALPENVTAALVGDAFSRLDPTQERVMQALAVYGRPVTPAAVDYLLQPHQPGVDSAPILGRLVNMHFARKEAGRYYLHPVDREYALFRIAPGEVSDRWSDEPTFTLYGLRHRAAEYFEEVRLPRKNWKTIEDLAPQLAEFDLRCEGQDYETAGRVLQEISFNYLMLWGWNRLVVDLNERLLGKLDDSRLKSIILTNQGQCVSRTWVRRSRPSATMSRPWPSPARSDDRRGEGIILGSLGSAIAPLARRPAPSTTTSKLWISIASWGTVREGISLNNLGSCYSVLGQTARAIDYHEQALAINREVSDRRGEGIGLGNLGSATPPWAKWPAPSTTTSSPWPSRARWATGAARGSPLATWAPATASWARRPAPSTSTSNPWPSRARWGTDQRGDRSRTTWAFATASLGQTARAIDYHEQYLAIARELGDRRGEGCMPQQPGLMLQRLGQTARAIDYHEQALAISREVGDRRGEGITLATWAPATAPWARRPAPSSYHEQGLAIAREVGDRLGQGHSLSRLAGLSIDEGRHDDAIRYAVDAVRIGEETGDPMDHQLRQ